MQFYIEGKKTQGIGYRAHLGMLALISGIDRLYADNLPKEKGEEVEKVVVYAGANRRKDIKKFYENMRQNIPKAALVDNITEPKQYHSSIESFPTVIEFVSTLTAQELAKGVTAITTLGEKAEKGFMDLGNKLGTVGKQVIDALIEAGLITVKDKKEDSKA